MRFELVEHLVVGKHIGSGRCEDLAWWNDAYVAVIDGATSTSDWQLEGLSGGAFVAEAIAGSLGRLEGGLAGRALVDRITHDVADALRPHLPLAGTPSAVFAVYSAGANAVTRVGDVGVLVGGTSSRPVKAIDTVTAEARSAYCQALLASGAVSLADLLQDDRGRRFIEPLLARQMHFQNNPHAEFGFGCINGMPVPDRFIDVIEVAPQNEIVLASDGYPGLCKTLAEAEQQLAAALREDPLCIGANRGTKGFDPGRQNSYDDRAYLRIRVLPEA